MLLLLKHYVFFYLASVTLADFGYPLFGYHVWLSCYPAILLSCYPMSALWCACTQSLLKII